VVQGNVAPIDEIVNHAGWSCCFPSLSWQQLIANEARIVSASITGC